MELKLTDILALERTYLANERTLLAYARSAFALFIAGVSFLKLFHNDTFFVQLGWGFIVISPLILFLGAYRSWRMHRQIQSHYTPPE